MSNILIKILITIMICNAILILFFFLTYSTIYSFKVGKTLLTINYYVQIMKYCIFNNCNSNTAVIITDLFLEKI